MGVSKNVELKCGEKRWVGRLNFQNILAIEERYQMGLVHLMASQRPGFGMFIFMAVMAIRNLDTVTTDNDLVKQLQKVFEEEQGYSLMQDFCAKLVTESGFAGKPEKVEAEEEKKD